MIFKQVKNSRGNLKLSVKELQVKIHLNVANFNCDVAIESLKNYMLVITMKNLKLCLNDFYKSLKFSESSNYIKTF